jgi:RNA polymerase sigma-70 factor (ECF subfamily)
MAGSSKVVRLVGASKSDASGVASETRARTGLWADAERDEDRAPEQVEESLVRALCAGKTWAERAFLETQTAHVERILTRILGGHPDLDDLTQEVFVRAFERVDELREPLALRGWLTAIAVFVARETIRKKQRRRWLLFLPPEETPDIEIPAASPEARAALRAFYEVLGHLAIDARIAFALRFVEGMELSEIAEACDVSLATIKRRIKSAEADFHRLGRAHAALVDWFEEGTRWRAIKSS